MEKVKKSKKIGKHYFQLVGKPHLYFKEEILVNFTPHRKMKNMQNRSIRPTYNNDQKYYTSAFLLPFSQLGYQPNQQQLRAEHDKRVLQSIIQISEPLLAKPRSKSKYCGVCRGYYEDYLEHIQSQAHVQHVRSSYYQFAIHKCCQLFSQKNKQSAIIEQNLNVIEQQSGKFHDYDDTLNSQKVD